MTTLSHLNEKRISEPYRLFFPLGMAIGLIGVALWPIFYAGWISYYPGVAHTRLMTQGFAGFFIFGFLMTAGPRLLGVKPFSKLFVIAIGSGTSLSCLAHLANRPALGDGLFAITIALLLTAVAKVSRKRTDLPPPGFPLAALGLLSALVGSYFLATFQMGWANPTAYLLGKTLLFQGFTVLPIVGIGPFFFPKILGNDSRHDFPEMMKANPEWRKRFRRSLICAIAFLASLVFEVSGQVTLAYGIRIIAFASYIILETPFGISMPNRSLFRIQLIAILSSILIGFIGAAFFPGFKVAWLHAYFLVGMAGAIFLVSVRVVFGHSGQPQLIFKSARKFALVLVALAIAAATRIYADSRPDLQSSHYIYAASIWIICALIWFVYVAPKTRMNPNSSNRGC